VEAKKQTYNSFDDLLAKSEKPVLVDFYATWCGPCQFMVPIFNEVSIRLKDTIQVVKIETEKYRSITHLYHGKPFERFVHGELWKEYLHFAKKAQTPLEMYIGTCGMENL
ncbi:hypothetical protein EUGRSUZ_F04223, partial [Eucalyptus grandis]